MEWIIRKLSKYAIKEIAILAFAGACTLAKLFPIFDDGNFKADAILYLVFFALIYISWEGAR